MKQLYKTLIISILIIIPITISASSTTSFKISEQLSVTKLNERSYIHTSYSKLENGNTRSSNGFIYVINKKAIVFDTPISNKISEELINWIENGLGAKIKSVIISHFHDDATGGLAAFKAHGITSYAHTETTESLWLKKKTLPDNSFSKRLKLMHEKMDVLNIFMGAGHSPDNIVTYFANENILFGGCLVKAIGDDQGNIQDANLEEWSHTISKIQSSFPGVKIVIPGHGTHGGSELLTYTKELFKNITLSQK